MSYILSGYFGEEPREKVISNMLLWALANEIVSKHLRTYTTADHTSFDLLNEVIGGMDNHAQATELGIIVEGESGTIYEIIPMNSVPWYRITCKRSGAVLCLPPKLGTEGLPLGDHLCGLVLGLRNDITTSRRIELLRTFLAPSLHRMYLDRTLVENNRHRNAIDSGGEEE